MAQEELRDIKMALDKPIGGTGAKDIDPRLAQVGSFGVRLAKEHAKMAEWFESAIATDAWDTAADDLQVLHARADKVITGLIDYPLRGIASEDKKTEYQKQQDAWRSSLTAINTEPRTVTLDTVEFGTEGLTSQFKTLGQSLPAKSFDDLAMANVDVFRRDEIERGLVYKKQLLALQQTLHRRRKGAVVEALGAAEHALVHHGRYPDMSRIIQRLPAKEVDNVIAQAREYCRRQGYYELEHHTIKAAKAHYAQVAGISDELRQQRLEALSFSEVQIRLLQMNMWKTHIPFSVAQETYREAKTLVATVPELQRVRAKTMLQEIARHIFLAGGARAQESFSELQKTPDSILYTRITDAPASPQIIGNMRLRMAKEGFYWVKMMIHVKHEMAWDARMKRRGSLYSKAWKQAQKLEQKLVGYILGQKTLEEIK